MAHSIKEPLCPLYREAIEASPWQKPPSAHTGLLFDKFAHAWRRKSGQAGFEFDKGTGPKKEGANKWLKQFQRRVGDRNRLSEACVRQRHLADQLGGKTLLLKNTDRFVTGMGREHPLENGFAWHHTLGVPYLPGSSLKGMLRAWLRETEGEFSENKRGETAFAESDAIREYFGTQDQVGRLILLDMLPISPPELTVDVMTPHYGPYYQDTKTPGDWHSPVPISFLAVEANQSWQLAIVPGSGNRTVAPEQLDTLTTSLFEALEWLGAGAKTAVGYGRFERDAAAEQRISEEEEKRRAEREAAAKAARDKKEFEASLAGDSKQLRKLKRLQREENWTAAAADTRMLDSLHEFADGNPDPPQDCLDWIRDWLESITKYKGVWSNPEAMQGKRGDKPKYKSDRIRNLVLKLNPHLRKQ